VPKSNDLAELVRYSRDGDQFHYIWAARRCLMLLSPTSGMVAVTIEGISGPDTSASRRESGAVAVDVGEYYGTDAAATASLVTSCPT
jgi:hypothetical protein